jgi:hypothetical protein
MDYVITSCYSHVTTSRYSQSVAAVITLMYVHIVHVVDETKHRCSQSVTAKLTHLWCITACLLLQLVVSTSSTTSTLLTEPDAPSHTAASMCL